MEDDDNWGDDGGGDGGDWGDDSGGGGGEGGKDQDDEWENAQFDDDGGVGGEEGEAEDGEGGSGGKGGAESRDIAIANIFYEAEDIVRESPSLALQKFLHVIQLGREAASQSIELNDESRTSLFHSQAHVVKLYYQMGKLEEMMKEYKILLTFIPKVTRNEGAEAIDQVLSLTSNPSVSASASSSASAAASSSANDFLTELYPITLSTLQTMGDTERMMFNVKMKLCKTYFEKKDNVNGQRILNELLRSCQTASGVDDRKNKGGELLELYALQIKQSMVNQDSGRLKELYEKTKDLTQAVKDPRSQSVIRECWGMMFGSDGHWQRAYAEFYSAFAHYQEIGNRDKAKQCLKYVVVANMLSGGEQNPFDAREAKVYQQEPDIAAIVSLRSAYEKCDVDGFSSALEQIHKTADSFISSNLHSMIRDFQARAILQTIKAYRRLKLSFLALRLKVDGQTVESIVVQLILNGDIQGKIDQVSGVLDLSNQREGGGGAGKKYSAIEAWTHALTSITQHAAQQNLALA